MGQASLPLPQMVYVVKYSMGVTSAWCAGYARRTWPADDVRYVWHDTKEEDEDTYRFGREFAAALGIEITERSDGRSVSQVFEDEEFVGNNQNTMCSRILKQEQGDKYITELQDAGKEVTLVLGFGAHETKRVTRAVGRAAVGFNTRRPYTVRFPIIFEGVTKQEAYDWCRDTVGVAPSRQYEWFDHANCKVCVKGGHDYMMKSAEIYPIEFGLRADAEERSGYPIVRGGGRAHPMLRDLVQIRLKRKVNRREPLQIGACECGD